MNELDEQDLPFTDPGLLDEIKKYCRVRTVVMDTIVISPGADIVFVPIVLKGVLRILRHNEEGKEIFLYHLLPGQTCAMAINCCEGHKKSSIKAIAEEDTQLLQIPVKLVEDWFKYPQWKAYVNSTYGTRFAELLEVIDLIAFSNMDKQVWHYLQERARVTGSMALGITHQQIADELHMHREAISRLLRAMEEKKMVTLGRNSIELLES